MLEILGISMKAGNYYRVMVKATEEMNKAWLDFLNEDCDEDEIYGSFEEAMEDSCFTSNDKGYLVMEIEIDLDDQTSNVVYYFDDYEDLDIELTVDEFNQCLAFVNEWKDKLPDNDVLALGDSEWYNLISNDIPWK